MDMLITQLTHTCSNVYSNAFTKIVGNIAGSKMYKLLLAILVFSPTLVNAEGSDPVELEAISTLATMVKPGGLFLSLILFIGVWLLLKMVKSVVDDLSEVFAEKRLLLQKALVFFQFIIYFIAIATATIISFEFSTELIALLGGTLAVAVGFAIKDLAASVIAGVIIMFDRPFQVGDRVLFGGEYGDVTAIGIRSVKMNTLDDNVVTIPNNIFLNGITSCGNYGELDMQVAIKFYIAVDQDLTLAQYIVREAAALSKFAYLKKPINVLVLQEMSNNMVYYKLTVKVYVLDTKYEKSLETDITLRVNEAFKKQGIISPSLQFANSNLVTKN
ncbi:mechanosensitive ion channel domain-containing protein [Colwellia sp. E2M01]|uniref:mechanosensitive ion channel family protein n=1 Tax=Colwellia sp. E2M01 TaxID=2841561 RepID=UPI001C091CD1|nr:mechanosensitive ion channel domain-containing protein [Colwellia sp. E2M01]MBU2872140.1 mechanosensitive ion channel family protein [Colwellia sp. E2M01]